MWIVRILRVVVAVVTILRSRLTSEFRVGILIAKGARFPEITSSFPENATPNSLLCDRETNMKEMPSLARSTLKERRGEALSTA